MTSCAATAAAIPNAISLVLDGDCDPDLVLSIHLILISPCQGSSLAQPASFAGIASWMNATRAAEVHLTRDRAAMSKPMPHLASGT
jgi:hypothetical protein